jgi:hypothetical protein
VPDRGGHRQDALGDADADALGRAAAVVFQVELALEGVVDRLDQLADLLSIGSPWRAFSSLRTAAAW